MKRDLEFSVGDAHAVTLWRAAPVWAVALAVSGILLFHWQTAASIVAIWIRSETFAHGFIIIPICAWLAWRRRDTLAGIPARPWWPGLIAVFVAGASWFVGSKAGAGVVQQFALAFMLQAAIISVIGIRQAGALAFPLGFLLFAVPTGEFLVPTLMEWTADFTVNALRASGVPVYRESNHFVIPSGAWSVVEACSGVRYVIASLVVGVIYAAVTYRSVLRRALFIGASIAVPIVANWLRAYMIVMLGHLSNNKIATGIDHIIYGWIFFGLVMLLLFWVGSFWRDPIAPSAVDAALPPVSAPALKAVPSSSFVIAAVAAILASAVWQPLDGMVGRNVATGVPVLGDIPGANGWNVSAARTVDWKPNYEGYVTDFRQTYAIGGRAVGLYIAYYRDQEKGHELITSENQLTTPKNWQWKQVDARSDIVNWSGQSAAVNRVKLVGLRDRIDALALYWIGGRVTASPYVAKALQAWSKLTGSGDDAALIVMYAPTTGNGEAARESLRSFAADMSPTIEHALASARESGR